MTAPGIPPCAQVDCTAANRWLGRELARIAFEQFGDGEIAPDWIKAMDCTVDGAIVRVHLRFGLTDYEAHAIKDAILAAFDERLTELLRTGCAGSA